jgi:predicted metal-binding membrane protein
MTTDPGAISTLVPPPAREPAAVRESVSGRAIDALLRRDRVVLLAALAVLSLASWAYLVYDARKMATTGACCAVVANADLRTWLSADVLLLFVMWAVMMVAMMAPTAAPMVLTFAAVNRRRRQADRPYVPTAFFLLGYLLAWTIFSAAATAAQWALHATALLSTQMVGTSPALGGAILVAAGVFQLTPQKQACLAHCRTPLTFIMTEWRDGPAGALRMGLRHGTFCLGCCWILMLVLFVTGVMNLLWVGLLTAFVLLEKLAPAGPWWGRVGGLLLIGWGAWLVGSMVR